MIDEVYVNNLIERLVIGANVADRVGHKHASELMRRSARLIHAMQREAELKCVAKRVEHVEIVDG